MNINNTLNITQIQRFCMHDGPGVRTTVFMKGCPLKCKWCHNPETQEYRKQLLFYSNKCIGCKACETACPANAHIVGKTHYIKREKCILCGDCIKNCPTKALQISGQDMTIEEILSVVEKDRAFYGQNGGVTLSGGEPLFQEEKTLSLLKACKNSGLSTAVETCGFAKEEIISDVVPFVDLFLFDIKDTDEKRHKLYTGVSNEKILNNLKLINEKNAKIRLRCILVNGINTDDKHYKEIANIAKKINNLDGVEFIPYHAYGGVKSKHIGRQDSARKEWIPDEKQIEQAKTVLKDRAVIVI